MNKYTFPLLKTYKNNFLPVALVTVDRIGYTGTGIDGKFIFRDGKSCDVHIAYVFNMDADVKEINRELQIADHGNCIVTNGEKTFQVAYKQTSPKS